MKQVTVTVPGKIMLAGEYAVLRGGSSLASTIDQKLTIQVRNTSPSGKIEVSSSLWDELIYLDTSSEENHNEPLLESTAICSKRFNLNQAAVSVDDGLKIQHGVGSSSALRFGVLLGFQSLYGNSDLNAPTNAGDRWDIARECYLMQKNFQKHASGYDIATQNIGGLVVMKPLTSETDTWPGIITRLSGREKSLNKLITTYVSEVGAATKPLVNDVLDWLDSNQLWNTLNTFSENLISGFIDAIDKPDSKEVLNSLIVMVKEHRDFFKSAPSFPVEVLNTLKNLDGFDESWTFKTTGAGGKDAILIIGSKPCEQLNKSLESIGWVKSSYKFSPLKTSVSSSQEAVH